MSATVALGGGAFEDEQTKKLANVVALLACISLLLIIIQVIVTFSSPEIQDILDGDLTALGFTEDEMEYVEDFDFRAAIIGAEVAGVLLFAAIMVTSLASISCSTMLIYKFQINF